jgi:hypothetical protein
MALKAPDKPPAPKARQATPKVAMVSAEQRVAAREEAALGVVQLLSFGCMMKGWMADAGALTIHGPKICHEAALVAESNETLGRGMDFLGTAGPYAALLTAALPLALLLVVNRGAIPAAPVASMGVVEPGTLEAQMRTMLLQQQIEAQRQQQAQEAALRQMLADAEQEETREREHAYA